MKIGRPKFPGWNKDVGFHPLPYYSVFLLALFLLSAFKLGPQAALWVGALGLLLPFLIASWTLLERRRGKGSRPSLPSRPLERLPIPVWLTILLAFLLLFTRFFAMERVPPWPMGDEGIFGVLAMSLLEDWNGRLLWAECRMEPLLIWSLGGFFHLIEPSLFSLRLFTVLLSLVTVLFVYQACRVFCSRALSLLCVWLFSLSFFSLCLSRQCTPNDLIPIFEWAGLYCLALYWKDPRPRVRRWTLLALVACVSLGVYSYVNGTVVWAFFTLVLGSLAFSGKSRWWDLLSFNALTLLAVLPLFHQRFRPGAMDNIQGNFGSFFDPGIHGAYLRGIFWDGTESFPLGPAWGGLFGPVAGALTLLGILQMLRTWPKSWTLLWFGGTFLTMLPGTLTQTLELQRITPSLPFWVIAQAWGAAALFPASPSRKHWIPIVGWVLLPSLAWEVHHFTGPYSDLARPPKVKQWRTLEYMDAYRVLRSQGGQGPFYLFTEFSMDYDNKTLNLAGYPFDALQNPRLSDRPPAQAALLVKVDYAPYLASRFPGTQFKELRTDRDPARSVRTGLFLVPTAEMGRDGLSAWIAADRILRDLNLQVKNKDPMLPWKDFADRLLPFRPAFEGDPFLRTVFWEKVAFFLVLSGDMSGASQAYAKAIQVGLPVPHLTSNYALSLKLLGKDAGTDERRKGWTTGDRKSGDIKGVERTGQDPLRP